MKRIYKQPLACPVETITEYMLMSSDFVGGGSDLEEPYELSDSDFNSIFG